MSLKVLLADDSAAIKKVVQLSLQDFGVELRSVASGKEVLDVARHYVPDIAFIDVLLPHQTGYEVAAQLKKDPNLKKIPVVMLWSAFMAFDEAKFKTSGADEKLEKPFEVNALRELVTRLVPKNQNNPLSMHLDFPKLEFEAPIGAVPPSKKTSMPAPPQPKAPPAPPKAQPAPVSASKGPQGPVVKGNPSPAKSPAAKEEWSMGSFDDIASFSANLETSKPPGEIEIADTAAGKGAVPVPAEEGNPSAETDFFNFGGTANKTMTTFFGAKAQAAAAVVAASGARGEEKTEVAKTPAEAGQWNSDNNEWVRKDLGKFKVPIPDENEEDSTVAFEYNENEIKNSNFLLRPETDKSADQPEPSPEEKTDIFKQGTREATKTAHMPPGDFFDTSIRPGKGPAANVSSGAVPRPDLAQPLGVGSAEGSAAGSSQNSPRYQMSEKDLEKIREEVRAEMRAVIERVVWKLVPEIASQIIRDEISRLTHEP